MGFYMVLLGCDMGGSKNRGTPKRTLYNGKRFVVKNPIKWMILGAHPYFWKHPYLYFLKITDFLR